MKVIAAYVGDREGLKAYMLLKKEVELLKQGKRSNNPAIYRTKREA